MNEKFLELSKEKQLKIINAGMEVFGKYEYKKASTDEIARIAGISKGLLFHYFKNKKTFYLYIYNFCIKLTAEFTLNEDYKKITDFFELLEYGSKKKMKLIHDYPHITGFIVKAFYSKNEEISNELDQVFANFTGNIFEIYFKYIDFSKFRDGVDPKEIFNMLTWMSEGYLFEKQRSENLIDIEEIWKDFNTWKQMFIKIAYKEEYQ